LGLTKIAFAKRADQVRVWQSVECTVYREKIMKFNKALLATCPPVGRMIQADLIGEDDCSIGEAPLGFLARQMDGFSESLYLYRTFMVIVYQYAFIVLR
jgi:hypothetical protein